MGNVEQNGLFVPKAVFFDWDGTLVDSIAFLTKVHNHALAALELPAITKEAFHHYFGVPRDVLFAEMYGAENAESAKKLFADYYHRNHLHDLVVIDGVKEMLDLFARLSIPMGVVSNKRGDFLREEIKHLGWGEFFGDRIVGSGDASQDKPNSAPLRMAVDRLGDIASDQIWYVGDTHIDVQCAEDFGCLCVLVAPVTEKMSGQAIVKNYAQICGFLLQSS